MTVPTAPSLWRHQSEAIEFVLDRPSTLLHMGMGTGKSRCAIEVAERMEARRVLILCPLSVVDAWEKQFTQFARRSWEVCLLNKGSVAKKHKLAYDSLERARAMGCPAVIVINYESARLSPFNMLAECGQFDLLIMDESHRLKSPRGKTAKWVAKLSANIPKRVALTGTPMPHSPLDCFQQTLCLNASHVFGRSFVQFRRRYSIMGGFQGKEVKGFQNIDDLRARLSKITYQADRTVLELPPAMFERRMVELSPAARRAYKQMEETLRADIGSGEVTASNGLTRLLRLQQLTSGQVTIDADPPYQERVDDSKVKALADLMIDLPPDEPICVFGQFRGDMETVHLAAKKAGRESLELSGPKKELKEWQDGQASVLAVQIQAGGVGVDLTRARIVAFLSTGFSLGDYLQALARNHRPGQDRTVLYYHFLAKDTVDLAVYHALRKRENVIEEVLSDLNNSQKKENV